MSVGPRQVCLEILFNFTSLLLDCREFLKSPLGAGRNSWVGWVREALQKALDNCGYTNPYRNISVLQNQYVLPNECQLDISPCLGKEKMGRVILYVNDRADCVKKIAYSINCPIA